MSVSRMWLAALVASGVIVGVVVVALITTSSGGDDVQTAAAHTTPSSAGKPVKVVIAGTNDALEPNTDGGIQGEGGGQASYARADDGDCEARGGVRGSGPMGTVGHLRISPSRIVCDQAAFAPFSSQTAAAGSAVPAFRPGR